MITENQRKFLLYFQPYNTYWKLTEPGKSRLKDLPLGFYPVSFKPRIAQGHYTYFDEAGVPCFPNSTGHLVHHYTTMCSYALGNWELYLETGQREYADKVLAVAEYIARSGVEIDESLHFLDYEDDTETTGTPCAMNQGEAISVLCRAAIISGQDFYLDIAGKAIKTFYKETGKGGVSKRYAGAEGIWFQEGGKYIMNGHIYSLFGIHELSTLTGDAGTRALFEDGCRALEDLLPEFDNGYWSWYWLDKPRYIASMMYHNLHIVQLKALYELTGIKRFSAYTDRFRRYAETPVSRARAAMQIFKTKVIN